MGTYEGVMQSKSSMLNTKTSFLVQKAATAIR